MPKRVGSKGQVDKPEEAFSPESYKELEREIGRLKKELEDSRETVEILKQVIKDYTEREKQKS